MQLSFADARPRRGLVLTVLPDAARVEERLTQLARERGLVTKRVACTVAQLERELVREAQRAGKCPPLAPPYAVELAIAEAAREHTPPSSALYRIREQPGFATALASLFGALGQGLLEPGELLELPLDDGARQRIVPLARILAAARARLERAQLVDPARALRLTLDAVDARLPLPRMLTDAAEVRFDAVLDWTPLRMRLAESLARRMPVRVRLPYSGGRPELTEALEPVLRRFEKLGEGRLELELFEPERGPLAPFLHALFAPGAPEDGPLRLVSCASPSAQAREVARNCRELIEAGAEPDAIAIAARSLSGGIAEEIAAALDAAEVPWRERRGRPALGSSPARLALAVLEMAERSFPRDALVELLSSRLLWLRRDDEKLPAHVLARVLQSAHARDDASDGGYLARLEAYKARLEARGADTAQVTETHARVRRVLRDAGSLPAEATLREHAAALLKLLQLWGLARHLRGALPEDAFARAAAAAVARDQAGARVLEETCAGLARAAAAVGLAERGVKRADFRRLLADALAEAALPPGGARGGAVQLVELRELHGRNFDHVLVAGLVDGELPAAPQPDPLLSDDDKRAINRAAKRGVFRTDASGEAGLLPPRQAEEPLLFHLALCAALRGAALFWPRADAGGREVLRSPFADEAERALGREAELVPIAPIPPLAGCKTSSALLARAALDAFAEPAWRVSPPADAQAARALVQQLGPRMGRIARAALAERERIRVFIRELQPGRFSGQLSGAALAHVQEQFGADKLLSAKQLEEHASCAFRTFGNRVLHIVPPDAPDDELTARERGTLLHRCVERYFAKLAELKRLPLHGDLRDFELLREVADETMDEFAAQEHIGHRGLWELRRADVHEVLRKLVEAEAELNAEPQDFEARFGYEGAWEPLVIRDGDDVVRLRGAIDRIDRTPEGVLVLDYKSSKVDSLKRKLKAETLFEPEFQLAVYAAVLRQRGVLGVDAAYVSLTSAERTEMLFRKAGALDDVLEMDPRRRAELRARAEPPKNLADAVLKNVREMRSGRFEVRPLSCDYCELQPACRLVALPVDPDENGGEASRA